jgi:hypothetical protein
MLTKDAHAQPKADVIHADNTWEPRGGGQRKPTFSLPIPFAVGALSQCN